MGSPVLEFLASLHEEYRTLDDGEVATYIPELGRADPSWFGICLATVDGEVFAVGDSQQAFTIQSISKPFVFGMALEDHGGEHVLSRVGVEPSGNAFNAIVVEPHTNRPFNPMVNAGAIVTTGLLRGGDPDARLERLVRRFSRYAGRTLEIDEAVYKSERATGDRNRAIGYLMASFGMLDGDVEASLDLYFRQCALTVTCRDLAVMAATLANRGTNPVTGERALGEPYVQNVLSVMETCGLYDYAGEWAFTVGLPAKSGVAGGLVAVLPGQFGIGVFSPRLDARGNSVRAIKVCQRLAAEYSLHPLHFQPVVRSVVRRSYRADRVRSNRHRPASEDDALTRLGSAVEVFELQGDLFFGSTELLYRRVMDDVDGVDYVVLDFRRVTGVDHAARTFFDRLERQLHDAGKVLLVAHGDGDPSEGAKPYLPHSTRRFADVDSALEWCETELLAASGALAPEPPPDLAAQELLRGLSADEIAAVAAVSTRRAVPAGETVFREGDVAESLYFLLAGSVSVLLPIPGTGRARRLATLGPGVAFGEMALLDEGRRSADVVAERDAVLLELPTGALAELGGRLPNLARTLFANLARNLSHRLRTANGQLRALEQ
ncbi:MAG TPA: glutaminase A [Acidimicrobiia bacterium]|nr:glutaminase A [Acidimicrobiia bacterium]